MRAQKRYFPRKGSIRQDEPTEELGKSTEAKGAVCANALKRGE